MRLNLQMGALLPLVQMSTRGHLASGIAASERAVRQLAWGANATVQVHVNSRSIYFTTHARLRLSTSMDPFMRKLHDRPINGKYVLIEKLGKGGFGVVYRGTHPACASRL